MKTITKTESREVICRGMYDGRLIIAERERSSVVSPRRKWYEDRISLSLAELCTLLSIAREEQAAIAKKKAVKP